MLTDRSCLISSYFIVFNALNTSVHISSVQFSHLVMSDSLQAHRLQHSRPPCPSPTPETCSNSYLSSQWCHPTISSSVIPFSSCLHSFPASGSSPMCQVFTSGGQSNTVSISASVLAMNIQDQFSLGFTALILQFKGLSKLQWDFSLLHVPRGHL